MNKVIHPGHKNGRKALLLLSLTFLTPFIFAIFFYLFPGLIPGKKNHGDLISPMRDVPEFTLQDMKGKSFTRNDLAKKWSVVYLSENACDEHCAHALYNIRQSRLAQGVNTDKVQYIYLAVHARPDAKLLAEHPDMIVLNGTAEEMGKLAGVLIGGDKPAAGVARIYLVEPHQRVMMSYAENFAPKGLIKDLELLLKVN